MECLCNARLSYWRQGAIDLYLGAMLYLIQDGFSCTLFRFSSVDCSHSRLWALVRVYFTLGKFPVDANSVVVRPTICIVGVSDECR